MAPAPRSPQRSFATTESALPRSPKERLGSRSSLFSPTFCSVEQTHFLCSASRVSLLLHHSSPCGAFQCLDKKVLDCRRHLFDRVIWNRLRIEQRLDLRQPALDI